MIVIYMNYKEKMPYKSIILLLKEIKQIHNSEAELNIIETQEPTLYVEVNIFVIAIDYNHMKIKIH